MRTATHCLLSVCCFLFLIGNVNTFAQDKKPQALKNEKQKVSYIIGTTIAKSLNNIKGELDIDILISGLKDEFDGKMSKIEEKEAQDIMRQFSMRMRDKHDAEMKEHSEKAIAEGTKFLAENKKKKGVITTESGLQYKILRKGEGPKPTKADSVSVNYKGSLIDGTEFDSSYKRGEPATFRVGGVIKGWSEALQLMNAGSKYELVIPPDLAYGERGAGEKIGPNEVLIFEVELLSVNK